MPGERILIPFPDVPMKEILTILLLFAANLMYSQNPSRLSLNGQWKLYYGLYNKNAPADPAELKSKNWTEINATVPGNIELDVLASGLIKNPETGNNIYALRKFEAYQWWYYRVHFSFSGSGRRAKSFLTVWIASEPSGLMKSRWVRPTIC